MRPCALAILVAVALASPAGAQRGADLLGFDAAAAGRAGVDVAIAETTSALLSNPAGLTQIEHEWRIDLTARLFNPRSEYEDSFNPGGEESNELIPAPYFGVAWDPRPGDTGRPGDFRLAAAVLHIAGFQSELDLVTQDFPPPEGLRRRVEYVYTGLHLGVAWRLTDRVSLGATVSLTYADLDVEDAIELSVDEFQGESLLGIPFGDLLRMLGLELVRVGGKLDTEPALGASATLGIMIEVSDDVTVGVTWRSPSLQQDFDADVEVDITRIVGEPDPITFPDGFAVSYDGTIEDFRYPQAVAIGVAWRACRDVRLAAELRWINWSVTHDALRLSLRNGDNPGFNDFVGDDALDIDVRLGFEDQLVASVAAEWTFAEGWTARAGFSAQTSAVPDDAVTPLSPAYSEFHVGMGLGYRAETWELNAAWLHTFRHTIDVGDSTVNSDFDGSRQRFAADSFFLTLSLFF